MIFLTTWWDVKSQDSALYVGRVPTTVEECWGIVPSIICSLFNQIFPIVVSWRICAIAHYLENFSKGLFCSIFHMRYIFYIVICFSKNILSILYNKSMWFFFLISLKILTHYFFILLIPIVIIWFVQRREILYLLVVLLHWYSLCSLYCWMYIWNR